jgi:hypothetical protein
MQIARHATDSGHLTQLFERDRKRLIEWLALSRTSEQVPIAIAGIAEVVYCAGCVVDPDSPEVPLALKVAAQADTAPFAFAPGEKLPRPWRLGEGTPVMYSKPADMSQIHASRWMNAFYRVVITRQSDLQTVLIDTPTDFLRQSSTRGEDVAYSQVDMCRAVWTDPHFTRLPAFGRVVAWAAAAPPRSSHGRAIRLLTTPYLEVLRQFERGDEAAFSESLTNALRQHRDYWSSTEDRRKKLEGLVSLPLTAVASLAWDRGMRFDVESDYIPTSWVRGCLFQAP